MVKWYLSDKTDEATTCRAIVGAVLTIMKLTVSSGLRRRIERHRTWKALETCRLTASLYNFAGGSSQVLALTLC